MSYLIAVFPDRITAEAAYSSLEKADIPMAAVSVLGRGYQSADEYGLIDPADTAWQQIRLMMLWLVPFRFLAGFSFNAITGLDTFPWAGTLGNQFLGGLLGAGSGALGAFFVGGGVGLIAREHVRPTDHDLAAPALRHQRARASRRPSTALPRVIQTCRSESIPALDAPALETAPSRRSLEIGSAHSEGPLRAER